MAQRLIVATRNEHKLRELAEILAGVELVALPDGIELPPESGETFAANALAKARAARAATGEAAIADDSGIEAAALGGRPGVRSARYAGADATDEQNLARLIAELAGAEDRGAAYVCVIAHVGAGGDERAYEGRCEGELAAEPRGSGGFGYDPAFVPIDTGPDDRRTMAELSPEEKHAISHRGRAARKLAAALGVGPAGEMARYPRSTRIRRQPGASGS
ncbi:MAG: RdgB/HAM1 family non-canonical purine NTP pyrophosphatase [Solirubrobacterales bacterium]